MVAAQPGLRRHQRRTRSQADAPRLDGTIGEEAAQVLLQVLGRCVATGRVLADGFQHDRFEVAWGMRIDATGARGLLRGDCLHQAGAVRFHECRSQRQQLVKRQTKTINVAAGVGLA